MCALFFVPAWANIQIYTYRIKGFFGHFRASAKSRMRHLALARSRPCGSGHRPQRSGRAYRSHASAYMIKPISLHEFLEAMRRFAEFWLDGVAVLP